MSTDNMSLGSLTAVYSDATAYPCAIGQRRVDAVNHKAYRFCYNSGATSWTIRVPVGVYLTGTSVGLCSFTAATQMLIKEGGTDVTAVVGIGLSTVANGSAGWLQEAGLATVETDGNVDAEEGVYVADNGIVAIPVTEPTHVGRFGVAATADGGTTQCSIWLDRCYWASLP